MTSANKASGTELIQELVAEGIHAVGRYDPRSDKKTAYPMPLQVEQRVSTRELLTRLD